MKKKAKKMGKASAVSKAGAAAKARPKLWVGRIPMDKNWGWLKLMTTKRWRLLRYRREEKGRECPWRVEIVTQSEAEFKRLNGLDNATQLTMLLRCSRRDARKLLKLIGEALVEG